MQESIHEGSRWLVNQNKLAKNVKCSWFECPRGIYLLLFGYYTMLSYRCKYIQLHFTSIHTFLVNVRLYCQDVCENSCRNRTKLGTGSNCITIDTIPSLKMSISGITNFEANFHSLVNLWNVIITPNSKSDSYR